VLANKSATVIIAVRNLQKGKRALDQINTGYQDADIRIMELDLANLESIRRFSEEFKQDFTKLDLLINNAGVMMPPYSKTADGFEIQFGTNHLGHFALTGFLLDLNEKIHNSRIVNVSSGSHHYGDLNFEDLNWENRPYKKMKAYGDSKIANLYFTYELQRRFEIRNMNVIATAAHPGWTATELQRHVRSFNFFTRFFAQGTEMGALPTLYAATGLDVQGGDYFGPSGWREMKGYPEKVESNKLSHDREIAAKLWDVSEELTGVKYLSD
jgi:NAD(P)-dependent dehydrogenase (short-subunit alcohol dehydrogenase family)